MRVLLTQSDATVLAEGLRAHGCAAVEVPLLAYDDLPVDWGAVPRADWLLLTSAHAAGLARGRVRAERVATVGAATARAWGAADVVGEGTGADLVARLGDLAGRTVVWPRAERAAAGTGRALAAAGARVVELVAYRNVAAPGAAAALAAARPWDVALLASPGAVDVYVDAGGRDPVVVIGPTTAEAARRRGLAPRVATSWDAAGVLAALP